MPSINDISEREQLILQAVVQSYITTAEPVGSRNVVKRFNLNLSAATVRNVMSDLEEKGYLQQLHTSSGRVPTDLGYRYYVDFLMRVQELTAVDRANIENELHARLNNADEVLKQTSHLLALVSQQAGLAQAPNDMTAFVHRIELMPLGQNRMAVLVADNFGRVRTLTLQMEDMVRGEAMVRLNNFLNEQLRGVSMDNLSTHLRDKLYMFLDDQRFLAEQALRLLQLVPQQQHRQLYLEGASHLFDQPEFNDIQKARQVFGLFEEQEKLVDLLRDAAGVDGTADKLIIIGSEQSEGMEGMSLIAARYCIDGKPAGMIGVLGPRRMQYSRLTAVVDYTAQVVEKFLGRLSG